MKTGRLPLATMLAALALGATAMSPSFSAPSPAATPRRRRTVSSGYVPARKAQSAEVREWNAKVEAKRLEKLSRRAARRTA